jgi:hypothetical protein
MAISKQTIVRYVVGACILIVAVSGISFAEERMMTFTTKGIEGGLERSSDDYIAVMVESTGDNECVEIGTDEVCFYVAKIIELYAGKGNQLRVGDTVRFLGSAQKNSRGLFFAIPAVQEPKIYGGSFASAKVGEEERTMFLEALHILGLRPDA